MTRRPADTLTPAPMWARARHRSREGGDYPTDVWDGYRRLALRVIATAFRDLRGTSPDLRNSAKSFLTGQPMLFLWCDVAQIRPAGVMARAEDTSSSSRLRGSGAGPRDPKGSQSATGMARLARAKASVS